MSARDAAAPDAGPPGYRIIPYEARFESDLVEICWETGLYGESLRGTGRFEDRWLFGLLFILPWLGRASRDQPRFVAVVADPSRSDGERAVGYIVGATDTKAQDRLFARHYLPRIVARLFLYSWWRYPESFRQVLRFNRVWRQPADRSGEAAATKASTHGYQAHLHTDILPEYQGRGIGSALMKAFLDGLRARGVPGVQLGTSDRNLKALPFYKKMGFALVEESPADEAWPDMPARGLTYSRAL